MKRHGSLMDADEPPHSHRPTARAESSSVLSSSFFSFMLLVVPVETTVQHSSAAHETVHHAYQHHVLQPHEANLSLCTLIPAASFSWQLNTSTVRCSWQVFSCFFQVVGLKNWWRTGAVSGNDFATLTCCSHALLFHFSGCFPALSPRRLLLRSLGEVQHGTLYRKLNLKLIG